MTDASTSPKTIERCLYELKKVIVGQEHLLERLLMAVLVGGHVLVEGAPGLAKTLTLRSLARVLDVQFSRIQFTPDLLPSDLVGTRIYNPSSSSFTTELGPLHANFVLADEINRAPAKVQSALLEAMQEHQVTIGKSTFELPEPFLVMATQNPLESQGTYPLPEAQMDRFLFKIMVGYPTAREEGVILQRAMHTAPPELEVVLGQSDLEALQQQLHRVFVDPALQHAMVDLVQKTRVPSLQQPAEVTTPPEHSFAQWISHGASPRGTLALYQASCALALLHGRTYVTPQDLKSVVHDCLRHRIILSYKALADGVSVEQVLDALLEATPLPQSVASSAPDA